MKNIFDINKLFKCERENDFRNFINEFNNKISSFKIASVTNQNYLFYCKRLRLIANNILNLTSEYRSKKKIISNKEKAIRQAFDDLNKEIAKISRFNEDIKQVNEDVSDLKLKEDRLRKHGKDLNSNEKKKLHQLSNLF